MVSQSPQDRRSDGQNAFDVREIPLDQVIISKANVRHRDITKGLDVLIASIKNFGLQQPIVVQRKGEKFEVIVGQRRFLAYKSLGKRAIPARILDKPLDEMQAKVVSFSENVVREELDPKDKSDVCVYLMGKLGTPKDVADHLGVVEATVRRWLDYAEVPSEIKEFVTQGKLSRGVATRIWAGTRDTAQAKEIAKFIVEQKPPKEERERVLTAAEELPGRPIEVIHKRAQELKSREKITFILDEVHSTTIRAAATRLDKEVDDVARDATVEWLEKYQLNSGR